MSYHYGNPHLDEVLSETQGNPHGDYSSILNIVPIQPGKPIVKQPEFIPKGIKQVDPTSKTDPPSIFASLLANLRKAAVRRTISGLGGIGLMMYPSELGHGMRRPGHIGPLVDGPDWPGLTPEQWDAETKRIQDNAQRKGPKNPRGMGVWSSGYQSKMASPWSQAGSGKPTKNRSQWQMGVERRAAKRAKEEEERERLRQILSQYRRRQMQAQQSRYSRPNTIPESLWKAYVPDEGMSNFSIWDDKGRYVGLDVGGLLEAIGIPPTGTTWVDESAPSSALDTVTGP